MSDTVYALLVGIDDYGGNPSSLRGCAADIEALGEILATRVGEGRYQQEKLLNREATRQRIIERFEAHLGQAGAGDVALFAYSGHGSCEPVEDRFWFLEPTGQNQTIVCADSRTDRVGDLADKELHELIRNVADNGPHVVVILDCCHSGGGTRDASDLPDDVRVRMAPPVGEPRPMEGYLPGVRAAVEAAADADASAPALGTARHVALSACEPTQLSKEVPVDGAGHRGAFSFALHRALTTAPSTATYRDLIGAAANAVRNRVSDQDPVVFSEGGESLDQAFLGGIVQPRSATIVLQQERDGWFIDAGRLHGIQPPDGGRTTVLTVPGVVGEPAGAGPLGHVRVVRVEPTRSAVEPVDFTPVPGNRYGAVVTELPATVASVELRGDADALERLRQRLTRSVRVREGSGEESGDQPRFVVLAERGRFTVARADGTPLTDGVGDDDAGAERTVARLEHLARWHEIHRLENPTSALAGQVTVEIVPAGTDATAPPQQGAAPLVADDTGRIRLAYERAGDASNPPKAFLYLHNRSDRSLYCTLLDLTDTYMSHNALFPVEEIAAGGTAVALAGEPAVFALADERIEHGGTRTVDWLKLFASEQRFEPDAFDLPELDGVLPVDQPWFDRGGERVVGAEHRRQAPPAPDWVTAMVTVVTERPADGVAVPVTGTVAVGDDIVSVEGHPALADARATIGAAEPPAGARDAPDPAPTALVRDPSVAVPVGLGPARSAADRAPDHLELTGELDGSKVNRESPVRLRLRADVADGDVVLAVAREGDLFIPLGTGTRGADGTVDVALARLPAGDSDQESTRGLRRSIRIFFQRIIDRRLERESAWPRLSVARATGEAGAAAVELVADPAAVAAGVAGATRTLLVVHGLLGDTRAMLPPLFETVGERYDCVLGFDFDTVGAGVEESARALLERLTAAGVTAERPLDVVAASSGALVVRWLVERLDAAALVRRAVLVGVPNSGTPWAAMQGWATATLAVGINGLSKVVWPAAALGALVGALERLDQGIDDLEPSSSVLADLAASTGPVPAYTVIAGNSSLALGAAVDDRDGKLGRLLTRIGAIAAGATVFRQPNDLLATTESLRAVPAQLDPSPVVVDVACDHMTYFVRPDSLQAIAAALR